MKRKIIIIILLVVILCLSFFFILKNKRNIKDTEGVVVLPTMNDKLSGDSTWCGTLQLVWNDMVDELLEGDIPKEENEVIANLNKMDFTTMMISEEYYYKKFGLKTISLKKEIEKGIKDKFNQTSDILDSFSWDDDNLSKNNDRYFIYTMLYREFEYNKKFSVLANDKFGNYDNIKYFGINKKSTDEVRDQIEVLFYNTKDDFAIKLHTKSNDEVILYKSPKGSTFNEIYDNMVLESNNYEGNRNFNKKDEFKAPFINFNVKKEYNELSNIVFISKSGNEYMIDTAIQTISFALDEKGGRIKSEAASDIKTTAMPNEEEKRYFNVDNTFVLFLKEEGKDRPYFTARIDDIRKYQ